jgi:hypothetical protein
VLLVSLGTLFSGRGLLVEAQRDRHRIGLAAGQPLVHVSVGPWFDAGGVLFALAARFMGTVGLVGGTSAAPA